MKSLTVDASKGDQKVVVLYRWFRRRGHRLRTVLEGRFTAERAPIFSRAAESVANWGRKKAGRGANRTGVIHEG